MLTFDAFIEELGLLRTRGLELRALPARKNDPAFRKWRHELTDLFSRIEAKKYRINYNVYGRQFDYSGSNWVDPSSAERMAIYQRDIDDTLMELDTIIDRAAKFGDPNARPAVVAPIALETTPEAATKSVLLPPPEKVTLAWLFQHLPINIWFGGLAVLTGVLGVGIALGQSELYADISAKFSRSAISPATASPSPTVLPKAATSVPTSKHQSDPSARNP